MDHHTPGVKSSLPSSTPGVTPGTGSVDADGEINWARVDKALEYFNNFDVLELASMVTSRALLKGPKDIYNEAGPVRYQLARAKQMHRDLVSTICAESLDTLESKIDSLERLVSAKRWIREVSNEQNQFATDESLPKLESDANNTEKDADGDIKLESSEA